MACLRGLRSHACVAIITLTAVVLVTACSGSADRSTPLQDAYERVITMDLPSVVQIDTGKSTGSGVVFDTKGDIVTNAHVVDGAKHYKVIDSVAARPLSARLVGTFAPDDLAVIRVTSGAKLLPPIRWADSDRARVGQVVVAMGSPLGLTDSVTQGIISATGRTVIGPRIAGRSPSVIADALQTSAAINPGNSGGALAGLSGAVLGIPTLEARDPDLSGAAEGIGFAIPSNTVRDIASQLIDKGRVTKSGRASLQVTGTTHATRQGNPDGVAVDAAQRDGAAALAGIKIGDIIIKVGGTRTRTLAELDDRLIDYKPGEPVRVDVLRGDKHQRFVVKLGSLSSGPA